MKSDIHGTQARYEEQTLGGHEYNHGRPSSWVLVGVVIAAFIMGGVAIIVHMWWLFWVGAGIVALAFPAGKIIGIMNDTVMVAQPDDNTPPAADCGTAADPGVRMEID